MTTPIPPSPPVAGTLPPPNVLDGHYRDHTDKVDGWSEMQVLEILAAQEAEVGRLRKALGAMLTHMGMDEDEWNKPTFDQARAALRGRP